MGQYLSHGFSFCLGRAAVDFFFASPYWTANSNFPPSLKNLGEKPLRVLVTGSIPVFFLELLCLCFSSCFLCLLFFLFLESATQELFSSLGDLVFLSLNGAKLKGNFTKSNGENSLFQYFWKQTFTISENKLI